jgi:primosomal protein N' (replication factor Y)
MQREAAGFPPFAHLALLRAEAKHADPPAAFLQASRELLQQTQVPLDLSGPLPAPMPRRAGYQRAQLLLSTSDRRAMHGALDHALPGIYALPPARKVRWSLDVDPMDLY